MRRCAASRRPAGAPWPSRPTTTPPPRSRAWWSQTLGPLDDLPADYLSLEVVINALHAASLSPRTYASAVIGFAQIVREGHPDAPIVVQSPI
jgi:hypothetical protein